MHHAAHFGASVSKDKLVNHRRNWGLATYAGFHVVGIAESNAPIFLRGDGDGAIGACWDDRDLRCGGGSERLGGGEGTIWDDWRCRGDGL